MRTYELTYDLPGANGGHRAEPRWFAYPEQDTDTAGLMTDEADAALDAAQRELDEYVAWLVSRGATHIRLNSDDLALHLPETV